MGQYYRPILIDTDGNETIYNRNINGKHTMAKLMEHSWWKNDFVGTICHELFDKPMRVMWVGDYADDAEITNGITEAELEIICDKAWNCVGVGIEENVLLLDNLYLVNITKKIYIDCNEYKEKCMDNGWCIHPLPLLTALGNGLGGGDYNCPTKDSDVQAVGSWANDLISIEETIPNGYEKISCIFKES